MFVGLQESVWAISISKRQTKKRRRGLNGYRGRTRRRNGMSLGLGLLPFQHFLVKDDGCDYLLVCWALCSTACGKSRLCPKPRPPPLTSSRVILLQTQEKKGERLLVNNILIHLPSLLSRHALEIGRQCGRASLCDSASQPGVAGQDEGVICFDWLLHRCISRPF